MKTYCSELLIPTHGAGASDQSDWSDGSDHHPSRTSRIGGLLALALALVPLSLRAQLPTPNPPERLSYQGYLVDANGNALGEPNPQNYDVIFRIWNDQSSTDTSHRLWSEQQTITVDKGYFSVLLGEGSQYSSEPYPPLSTLFDAADASERYVEVTVKGIGSGGTDVTISPRLRLLTSPYAFLAQKALNAATLVNGTNGTIVSSDGNALTVNGTLQANSFTTSGNVTAGSFSGNGSGLTSLNGANLSDGSVSAAKLSSDIGVWTESGSQASHGGDVTFTGNLIMNNTGIIKAYNNSGVVEDCLYPRWSDNATYLDFGTGGFHIRNDSYGEVMFMDNAGNVGIGTTSPGAPLHVTDSSWPTEIVDGSSIDGTWLVLRNTSLGGKSWHIISTGSGNGEGTGKLIFVPGPNPYTTSAAALTLTPSGLVGIGTASPSRGQLEIVTSTQTTMSAQYGYLNSTGPTGIVKGGSGSFSCAIYADGRVVAPEVDAFSDARLKHVEGISNGRQDLRTLMGIQITDYRMVDTVAEGTRQYKKVIAQQVERVYPQAVSRTSGTVPDIYTRAEAKAGWIQFTKHLSPPLKVGDKVKLITGKSSALHEVLEVKPDGFRVKAPLDGPVFVYGREVKDLRTVDYDAIAMLNVSATQELCRQLQTKDAEIQRLQEEVETLAAGERVQAVRFEKLETLVNRMRFPIERASLR